LIERRLVITARELHYFRERNVTEAEQLYRRGCEYFFGTNGYGERGEGLSRTLGLFELKKSADLGHVDAKYQIGQRRAISS
jgi:hypothetical protein